VVFPAPVPSATPTTNGRVTPDSTPLDQFDLPDRSTDNCGVLRGTEFIILLDEG